MGSLRNLSSEGTKERKADELDRMDLAHGVPPQGVPLVLCDKDDDKVSVEFKATRSDFLEKIRKAWRDYASHPRFSGKPAWMAIQVCAYYPDGEEGTVRLGGGTDWLIRGEVETQEAANALWEHVVKMWASIKDKPWLRNAQ